MLRAGLFDAFHAGGTVPEELLDALQALSCGHLLGFGRRDRSLRFDALIALGGHERRNRHQPLAAAHAAAWLPGRGPAHRPGHRRGHDHAASFGDDDLAADRAGRRGHFGLHDDRFDAEPFDRLGRQLHGGELRLGSRMLDGRSGRVRRLGSRLRAGRQQDGDDQEASAVGHG